jgi:hypothetical protein
VKIDFRCRLHDLKIGTMGATFLLVLARCSEEYSIDCDAKSFVVLHRQGVLQFIALQSQLDAE